MNHSLPMPIPARPYVALYGSHVGSWRQDHKPLFESRGVAYFDPIDPAWGEIDHENGDRKQPLINRLVETQRQAMLGAAAVLFYLGETKENSPAARFELGMLSMSSIPVFLHVDPVCRGRNYAFAQQRLSPNIQLFSSLQAAAEAAIEHMLRA